MAGLTRQNVRAQDDRMPMSIVAFADALGTAASTAAPATASDWLDRLERATKALAPRFEFLMGTRRVQIRWFSDSIAMSCPLTRQEDLRSILENLSYAQVAFAKYGVFLRGAVTKGTHHHGPVIDYGPALVQAVKLEKEAGDAARIILSKELEYDAYQLPRTKTGSPPIVEDVADNVYFLDFLRFLPLDAVSQFRDHLEMSYASAPPESATAKKYAWLAAYFNWRKKPAKPMRCASDQAFREISKS